MDGAFGGVVVIARSWRGRAGWQGELSAKAANRQFVAGAAGQTGAGSQRIGVYCRFSLQSLTIRCLANHTNGGIPRNLEFGTTCAYISAYPEYVSTETGPKVSRPRLPEPLPFFEIREIPALAGGEAVSRACENARRFPPGRFANALRWFLERFLIRWNHLMTRKLL